MSVNKVTLIGRLGADPESRTASSGTSICKFRIATDRRGKGQGQTDWHNITTFGRTAERCGEYLRKGRQVFIEGRIQYNKSESNGQWYTDIVAHDVQFLSGHKGGGDRRGGDPDWDNATTAGRVDETDIPF